MSYPYIWIDVVNDNVWNYNKKDVTESDWQSGEPNPFRENCAGFVNQKWVDLSCGLECVFICELDF